jgi:hypothetical protein
VPTTVHHRAQPRRRMEPTPRVATVREVDAVKQGEVPGKLMKLLGMTPVQAQLADFASCRRWFHRRRDEGHRP